jgi:hypothetical protein
MCWTHICGCGTKLFKVWAEAGGPVAQPVILTTQEAEIRRIEVQSQPQANSSRDPMKNI